MLPVIIEPKSLLEERGFLQPQVNTYTVVLRDSLSGATSRDLT